MLLILIASLLPYVVIGLVIWGIVSFFDNRSKNSVPPPSVPPAAGDSAKPANNWNVTLYDQQHAIRKQRDDEWLDYIKSLESTAKTKAETDLIQRILHERGHAYNQTAYPAPVVKQAASPVAASPAIAQEIQLHDEAVAKQAHAANISNTVLLLYFGAFLFVASSGLFVAFGGLNGVLRTMIVLLVMIILYASGFWLYEQPRLKQAGVTFVAIGMAIAPLVGVAFFNFISNKTNAPLIWAGTSLLCLCMYAYTLVRIRTALNGYLVLFSFVSLFEAGVSIIDVQIYYFIWGLLFIGLVFQAISYMKGTWKEIAEPAGMSARVIMPLMVAVSWTMVQTHGYATLAISLLLSSAYYLLEGIYGAENYREMSRVVAHVAFLGGLLSAAYSITKSPVVLATILLLGTAAHIVVILTANPQSATARNIASVALCALIAAPIAAPRSHTVWLLSALLGIVIGWVVGLRQGREEGVVYGSLSLLALPIVIGQIVLEPRATTLQQLLLNGSAMCIMFGLAVLAIKGNRLAAWTRTLGWLFGLAGVMTLLTSGFAGRWETLLTCLVISVLFLAYGRLSQLKEWEVASGLVISLPVLLSMFADPHIFFPVSVAVALAFNIILALWLRHEENRWTSTILWLLLPLAVGLGGFTVKLGLTWFAWAYLAAAAGLILSRAIARGVVFVSPNIPLMSYARNTSFSYVCGYVVAIVVALGCALQAPDSQLHGSLMLAAVLGLILLLARYVEKQPLLYAALPIFIQAILFSAVRPRDDSQLSNLLLAVSVIISIVIYTLSATRDHDDRVTKHVINFTALATAYASVFFLLLLGYPVTGGFFPLAVMMCGLLTLHYNWETGQSEREMSILILVASFFWLLFIRDIRNIHAYTHILAGVFAAFAGWRYWRKELDVYRSYVQVAFFIVTVPLILQVLSGVQGDSYGWILIIEQVLAMIIGMTLRNKFLVWAGLYVALGSVLYQLRHLGWAALLVLALFVIGIAMRRLYKVTQAEPVKEKPAKNAKR